MAASNCWCGKPRHNIEVQCSRCKKYFHAECLGLSFPDFSVLFNQEPGLYLCRICVPITKKAVRDNLLKANPENTLFEFNLKMHNYNHATSCDPPVTLAEIENALDVRIGPLETKIISSIVDVAPAVTQSVKSFAEVVSQSHGSPDPGRVSGQYSAPSQRRPRAPVIYHADPTRGVLISKVNNPRRFEKATIKDTFTQMCPNAIPLISHARLLNSGKLMVECCSGDQRNELIQILSAATDFGQSTEVLPMNARPGTRAGEWFIMHGIDRNAAESLCDKIAVEYKSIEGFSAFSAKEGQKFVSAKFRLTDQNEKARVVVNGCFADFCHYRVSLMVSKPNRCFKCHKFGHVAAVCRSAKRCRNCGSEDPNHDDPCPNAAACCNCHGSHSADDQKCPVFVERFNHLKSIANNV